MYSYITNSQYQTVISSLCLLPMILSLLSSMFSIQPNSFSIEERIYLFSTFLFIFIDAVQNMKINAHFYLSLPGYVVVVQV
jgi:hypothetical protein